MKNRIFGLVCAKDLIIHLNIHNINFKKMKEKNTYVIYFDLFGKSYKTSVIASSKEQAQEMIKNKIIFVNVIKKSNDFVTDKNV